MKPTRAHTPLPSPVLCLARCLVLRPLLVLLAAGVPAAGQDAAAEIAPAEAGRLLAVDVDGVPQPGVSFDVLQSVRGALEEVHEVVTTGPDGWAEIPPNVDGLGPVDIEVARASADRWALRFLHATPVTEPEAGVDALGRPLVTLDAGGQHVAVLEPTGTLRLEVSGVRENERLVATFIDERPEPELHRGVRATRAFVGPSAALHLPPGRGYLHVVREEALGGYVQDEAGSLHVAVRPGATTLLRIAFTDGPVTTLQAPFESIPFGTVQSLGLDGETVAGSFAFESSPLRIPSSLPHVVGLERDGEALARDSRAKAPLRARGIPIVRDQPGVFGNAGGRGFNLANAPVALIFGVDIGRKTRLPEDTGGWIQLARAGLAAAGGGVPTNGPLRIERPRPGKAQVVPSAGAKRSADAATETYRVQYVDPTGAPLAWRELAVPAPGQGFARVLTDAEGRLELNWHVPPTAVAIDHPGSQQAAAPDRPPGTRLVQSGGRARVTGTWKGAGPGVVLALGPPPEEGAEEAQTDSPGLAAARARFAWTVAVTDARGRFDFGQAPSGASVLIVVGRRPDPTGESGVRVEVPEEGSLQLTLSGPPDAPRLGTGPGD